MSLFAFRAFLSSGLFFPFVVDVNSEWYSPKEADKDDATYNEFQLPWITDIVGLVALGKGTVDDAITYHLGGDSLRLGLVTVEEVTLHGELGAEVGAEVFPRLDDQENLEGVFVGDPAQRTIAERVSQLAALAGERLLALLVLGQRFQKVVQL